MNMIKQYIKSFIDGNDYIKRITNDLVKEAEFCIFSVRSGITKREECCTQNVKSETAGLKKKLYTM